MIDLWLKLEKTISETISEKHPNSWDENHISYSLLENLRKNLHQLKFDTQSNHKLIEFTALKLKGSNEEKFGDLGILINIEFKNRDNITGVAFLEAKRRYTNNYDSINFEQLIRISKEAPYSQMLLYDFEKISHQENIFYYPIHYLEFETNAVTLPINLANYLNSNQRKILYPNSTALSTQFINRFFRGYDLHFGQKYIDILNGAIPEIGRPPLVALVSITYDQKDTRNFGINFDDFELIQPD